jgi:hypothetical protein
VLTKARIGGAALTMLAGLVRAQGPPGNGMSSAATGGNPFLGSVPQGTATGEELPLPLADAIARGLRFNLGPLLADQGAWAARGAGRAIGDAEKTIPSFLQGVMQ